MEEFLDFQPPRARRLDRSQLDCSPAGGDRQPTVGGLQDRARRRCGPRCTALPAPRNTGETPCLNSHTAAGPRISRIGRPSAPLPKRISFGQGSIAGPDFESPRPSGSSRPPRRSSSIAGPSRPRPGPAEARSARVESHRPRGGPIPPRPGPTAAPTPRPFLRGGWPREAGRRRPGVESASCGSRSRPSRFHRDRLPIGSGPPRDTSARARRAG